ncbi:hypothetical protein ACFO5X_13420 [Seohaeicola nanhaiensis]|uniref:Uncharacterized protein n=1 Tax=Seohaeicola nanhaiensis TaxID=1387282 RepID=A0ABV9KIZ9_9RHOB
MRTGVLEQIWQGVIRATAPGEGKRVRRIIQAMIPAQTVFLSGAVGSDRAHVFHDEMEVMPELGLGDVIVEELSVDVPYGSLVVICDEDCLASPVDLEIASFDVGIVVAKTLLGVLRLGAFPIERENEALYVMACAYERMARSAGLQQLGLIPSEFSKGLTSTLGAYWSGAMRAHTDRSGLFLNGQTLSGPEVRAYLQALDPAFAAPAAELLPSDLLVFSGGRHALSDWLEMLRGAVNAVLVERKVGMNWEVLRQSRGI